MTILEDSFVPPNSYAIFLLGMALKGIEAASIIKKVLAHQNLPTYLR